jgi:hypothetical protein
MTIITKPQIHNQPDTIQGQSKANMVVKTDGMNFWCFLTQASSTGESFRVGWKFSGAIAVEMSRNSNVI